MRDYLNELLGEDSSDKETARKTLGIDLTELLHQIETKADVELLGTKADVKAIEALQEEIVKKAVPVGSIHYFAMVTPPVGYLKADGAAVERAMYPALFAVIGTMFGEGDGKTSFNLPDLIGRFAEGSDVPGIKKEAGLPNITGKVYNSGNDIALFNQDGTIAEGSFHLDYTTEYSGNTGANAARCNNSLTLDASRSSPLYGASSTVQPRALTLLPCIKAFHA